MRVIELLQTGDFAQLIAQLFDRVTASRVEQQRPLRAVGGEEFDRDL